MNNPNEQSGPVVPLLVNPLSSGTPEAANRREIENRMKTLRFIRDNTALIFFNTIIQKSIEIEGFQSPIQYEDSQRFLTIQNDSNKRDRYMRWGFIGVFFGGEAYVARKSIAYRITQTHSLGRFVMKLLGLPILCSALVNLVVFNPSKNGEIESILSRYNFKSAEFDDAMVKIAESGKDISIF